MMRLFYPTLLSKYNKHTHNAHVYRSLKLLLTFYLAVYNVLVLTTTLSHYIQAKINPNNVSLNVVHVSSGSHKTIAILSY